MSNCVFNKCCYFFRHISVNMGCLTMAFVALIVSMVLYHYSPKNPHGVRVITYVVYPASTLPEDLRSEKLDFLPPKCIRIMSGTWTDDALILKTEHDCTLEPQEHIFNRTTDYGKDVIVVREH